MSDGISRQVRDSIRGLACWKVGLAHGSLVYFELGRKLRQRDRDEVIGEATLWLEADDWVIDRSGELLASSESIDRVTVETELGRWFAGQEIEELSPAEASITIKFTDGLSVIAWRPKDAEIGVDEDLVEFFLPDGRIACFTEASGLFLSDEVDDFRAARRRGSVDQV